MARGGHMATFKDVSSGSYTKSQEHIQRTIANSKVRVNLLAAKTSDMMVSLLSTILTVVLVLAVSVFLYGTFYYAYMPVEMHNLPVHLQFQPCSGTTDRCSHPTANIALRRYQKLLQGQPYSISLNLEIPDSPVNEDLGMFMSCLTISSTKGDLIGEACKSSISEYRSSLLRTMETISYSPALLTGWSAQKQEVHINYFSNFQTDPHTPAEVITVEIKSKYLQISEASLQIHAELNGLRHLMYRHPWFSSFLGVSFNILILSTIILVSWARFLQPEEDAVSTDSTETPAPTFHSSSQPPQDSTAAKKTEFSAQAASKDNLATITKPSEESKAMSAPTLSSKDSPKSSLSSRFTWFLVKLVAKLLWQSFKLFLVVAVAVISYEAVMVGVDTNNPEVLLEATKQDMVFLVKFLFEKSVVLVEIIRKRISAE